MRKVLILGLVMATALPSCVSKKKFTEMMNEKDNVASQLAKSQEQVRSLESNVEELNSKVEELSSKTASLESQNASLTRDVSQLKTELTTAKKNAEDAQMAAQKATAKNEALMKGIEVALDGVDKSGLTLRQEGDYAQFALAQPIRYKSGSTRLTKENRESIKEIATVLAGNPDLKVQVEGYTDFVPLKPDAPWANNRELSMARANGVVRELIRHGVKRAQISTKAYTQDKPAGTATISPEVMAEHRKSEIVLIVSKFGHLYSIKAQP